MNIYQKGDVKSFTYHEKGNWIIVELTEDAIKSGDYDSSIQMYLKDGRIKSASEFRTFVKVLSKESFIEFMTKEGNNQDIKVSLTK